MRVRPRGIFHRPCENTPPFIVHRRVNRNQHDDTCFVILSFSLYNSRNEKKKRKNVNLYFRLIVHLPYFRFTPQMLSHYIVSLFKRARAHTLSCSRGSLSCSPIRERGSSTRIISLLISLTLFCRHKFATQRTIPLCVRRIMRLPEG